MDTTFDFIGKRFGNWTVLAFAGVAKAGRDRLWLCKCDCGKTSKVKTYYLTKGYSTKCVYCAKHTKRYYSEELPEVTWKRVRRSAAKRNIPLKVTRQEAYSLFLQQNKKCKLTGLDLRLPTHGGDEAWTASLDRIDSEKPYTINNVQWIHKDVNRIKNIFDEPYFLSLCRKIVEHCQTRPV